LGSGAPPLPHLRFGIFEIDFDSGELRKAGAPVRLQPQPFKILALLASRPGQLVTRQEIQQQTWGTETFVDFESGLNFCIKQIRMVLGDDAETPHYIETLPRRGYRFIAQVDGDVEKETSLPPAQVTQLRVRPTWRVIIGLTTVAALVLTGFLVRPILMSRKVPGGKLMLAVLPFENLSGDPGQEYFSDGLTDETITQLGRLRPARLGVIAETSAMQYKNSKKTIDRIGKELQVDYILEGAVVRTGERVRITAQLIQVSDQTHLWAESYERDVRDILSVQDEVARSVAKEMQIQFTPQEQGRPGRAGSVDFEAHDAYLLGLYYWNKRTTLGYRKSGEYFRKAIARDPGYALAYSGLAESFQVSWQDAREAALKAIELDPSLAEAHTSLAFIKTFHDWDWAGAEREYKRAIELNPNYATAHHWYGEYLAVSNQLPQAVTELRTATRLDPLSLIIRSALADELSMAGDSAASLEQLRQVFDMDPNFPKAHLTLGQIYLQRRMFNEAIHEFQMAKECDAGNSELMGWMGYTQAVYGNKPGAEQAISELVEMSKVEHSRPDAFSLALVQIGLGHNQQALSLLEEAYAQRNDGLLWLNTNALSVFDPLRPQPRFQDLVRRVGLPR
jgi:TolB-like protein/DNA-binding winged helix-turn-helix (wHTH) protein/Flp pilus assembly protein TadD